MIAQVNRRMNPLGWEQYGTPKIRETALRLVNNMLGGALAANGILSQMLRASAEAALVILPALWYEIRFLITLLHREQP